MKDISDSDRLGYLLKAGYIPNDLSHMTRYLLSNNVSPTVLLDYMFGLTFGPAYWRKPVVNLEEGWTEATHINGLVFVRPCDRERIDMVLNEQGG
jgi:hypothetical protein